MNYTGEISCYVPKLGDYVYLHNGCEGQYFSNVPQNNNDYPLGQIIEVSSGISCSYSGIRFWIRCMAYNNEIFDGLFKYIEPIVIEEKYLIITKDKEYKFLEV
jgi:hypothetical protein